MAGGSGDDLYIVGAGDVVAEGAASGVDTVESDVSWTLSANVERLVLTGVDAISGRGNALANRISGNDNANKIDGFRGSDRLFGMAGNDTLLGGIGRDFLVGGAGDDVLNGGVGKDQLFGGDGDDRLFGSFSGDQLTGGAGKDFFIFSTRLSAIDNVDVINDFTSGEDKILLDDDVFKALNAGISKTLLPGQFLSGAGATQALDADQRIIYDTDSGALYYDADGSGAAAQAIRFATVSATAPHPPLSAADFIITNWVKDGVVPASGSHAVQRQHR